MNVKVKVLSAKYEKPHHRGYDYAPETLWQFVATTDNLMPHNADGFGGLLRKEATTGLWQARHYQNTDWGKPAADRVAAIQNIVEDVLVSMAAHRQQVANDEAERNARHEKSKQLTALFPKDWKVNDENGWHVERESAYTVAIKGITEEQVRKIADFLTASVTAWTCPGCGSTECGGTCAGAEGRV
jgi:hypothetical protein